MNISVPASSLADSYGLQVEPLGSRVVVKRGETVLADSIRALVMYETRLSPTIYLPKDDIKVPIASIDGMRTFCPFKGTATYWNLTLGPDTIEAAAWSYENALTESREIEGYLAFTPKAYDDMIIEGEKPTQNHGNISGPTIDWMMRQAAFATSPEALTKALAERFIEDGIAISRMSILIWSLHPLIAGKNYIWDKNEADVAVYEPSYDLLTDPTYVNSPLRHVTDGLGGVRQKLLGDTAEFEFPIMKDLQKKGATDYVAMPLTFSNGQHNVLTIASDHPQGFTTANLGLIFECSAVVARYYEVFMQRENAQSLLETYVGKRTGERVLGGKIRRGEGDEIDAAIMFCDLRGSTLLQEQLGRHDYIKLLNAFFDTASTIVHDNGGEVLKFIGDAVLAVFPASNETGEDADQARAQALKSACSIVPALAEVAAEHDLPVLECASGIAYGTVTYGNVGSRERLDFTVIGQAANIAARLGDYGKTLGHQIVVSQNSLPGSCQNATSLGALTLHNISKPVESYAVAPFVTAPERNLQPAPEGPPPVPVQVIK